MPTILHNKPRDPGEEMLWRSDIHSPHGDVVLRGGKHYVVDTCVQQGHEKYLIELTAKPKK